MSKNNIFAIISNVTYGRGYIYSLQYHIVWCTKYRRKIIMNDIELDVKEHLYHTTKDLDIEILAMETMPDHIHMLIECRPQCRISDALKTILQDSYSLNILKSKSNFEVVIYGIYPILCCNR